MTNKYLPIYLSFFVCILFSLSTTIAQPVTWKVTSAGQGTFSNPEPYGTLLEQDNSFMWITGTEFREVSHYGRFLHHFFLPTNANITGKHFYYFLDKQDNAGTDYVIAAYRGGDTGGTYINIATMDGALVTTDFFLDDEVPLDALRGLAAIKNVDGDYLFFGQAKIYKVAIEAPSTINIIWEKGKTNAPVSAVKEESDGYVICGEDGTFEKYDLNGDLMWSNNLTDPAYDVVPLGGRVLCCRRLGRIGCRYKSGRRKWNG